MYSARKGYHTLLYLLKLTLLGDEPIFGTTPPSNHSLKCDLGAQPPSVGPRPNLPVTSLPKIIFPQPNPSRWHCPMATARPLAKFEENAGSLRLNHCTFSLAATACPGSHCYARCNRQRRAVASGPAAFFRSIPQESSSA